MYELYFIYGQVAQQIKMLGDVQMSGKFTLHM